MTKSTHWIIDTVASTATHASGLTILFEPAEDAAGAWDGRIISAIHEGLPLDAQQLARLMREAGEAFVAALKGAR